MEIDLAAAALAGLIGTAAMTVVLYAGIMMMPAQMTMNLLYMEGSMVVERRVPAYVVGGMLHAMMGVGFAVVHVGLYQVLNIESGFALWGLAIGLAHAVMMGAVGLPMVGAIHPVIRAGRMKAPGFMVMNHPMGTVVGFFVVHAIFGVTTALVYQAIA